MVEVAFIHSSGPFLVVFGILVSVGIAILELRVFDEALDMDLGNCFQICPGG